MLSALAQIGLRSRKTFVIFLIVLMLTTGVLLRYADALYWLFKYGSGIGAVVAQTVGNALNTELLWNNAGTVDGTSGFTTDGTTITGTGTLNMSGGTVLLAASHTLDAEWDTIGKIETAIGGVNILLETEIDASSELAALMDDETGTGLLVFGTSPTLTTPIISGAVTFPDGVRQTFNPNATVAGVNVGSQTGDPSTPINGDIWYDSTANELTAQINGANVTLGSDTDAIHDNASGEIAAVTAKTPAVAADFLLIEDSEASNAKKSITVADLETALEGVLDLQDLQGAVTETQIPDDMAFGNITVNQLILAPSAIPTITLSDSDMVAADKTAATITADCTDCGDGTEDTDVTITALVAGAPTSVLTFDASAGTTTLPHLVGDFSASTLTFPTLADCSAVTGVGDACYDSVLEQFSIGNGVSPIPFSDTDDQTLQEVITQGRTCTDCDSLTDAVRIGGSGTSYVALFNDPTEGPVVGAYDASNNPQTWNWHVRDNDPMEITCGNGAGTQVPCWRFNPDGTLEPINGVESAGTIDGDVTVTGTLTANLNVEDTGSTLTTTSQVWLPAAGCSGTTGSLLWDTLATLPPTATCSAGSTESTLMRAVADYPDSDGNYGMQQPIFLPDDFTGAVDATILWRSTAITGNVVWQLSSVCMGDGEVDDAAYNAASTVTDTAKGTTNQLNTATITGVTMTGCAANDLAHFKILRQRTHASDTIAGVISLAGVRLKFRRAQ